MKTLAICSKRNMLGTMLSIFLCFTSTSFASDFFAPYISFPIGATSYAIYTTGISTADFNNDGTLDLVTMDSDYFSGRMSIFLGNGDGTFKSGKDYPVSSPSPMSVAPADFDNDGNIDIAVIRWAGEVLIFIGKGDGTFEQKRSLRTGILPIDIATGDFNGDHILDLVALNYGGYYQMGSVSVFIGNGDGTFQSKIDSDTGHTPWSITAADFNSDGKIDLATTSQWSNYISVVMGNGDGTFKPRNDYPTRDVTWAIVSGDFNGDGWVDLAGADFGFIGNGDGTFQPTLYGAGDAAGDFNNDGKLDLVKINYWENSVSLLIGNGDGTFQPRKNYLTDRRPSAIAVGDFNNDGQSDLATYNISPLATTVSILLNSYEQKPSANAGPDQGIECAGPSGTVVVLDASASSDRDGDPLTYTWTWPGGSAEGVNPTVALPLGTTVVTLTVSDGKATATDTVNITVQDKTPPVTTATGGSDNWYNANIISTFSATDSCSGVKEIHYTVNGTETVVQGSSASVVITSEGTNNITYFAVDNAGNIESSKGMSIKIDKTSPVLNLFSTPNILWPPNHEMVDVLISGNATDTVSGIVSVAFTVTDEYGQMQPSITDFNTVIPLEAWREGADNDGRYYTITSFATDAAGNKTTTSTTALVPHDQGN